MNQKFTPAVFIALFNVVTFAVLIGFHLATQTPIQLVTKWMRPGADFHDFYQASTHILNGESPYLVVRYVTPPLFAFLNVPLSLFKFEVAHVIFISLIPFMILISYLLVYRTLKDSNTHEDNWLHLSVILVILFSYPLYFLFERGNIDGVVLFCMCAGLFMLSRKTWLGSLLLAAASLFKLYPILILASLFFTRRWKSFLWACGWIVVLILLTIPYWDDYLALSHKRLGYFRIDENGSLVNTIMMLTVFMRVMILGKVGSTFDDDSTMYTAILYALLVVMMFYTDYKLAPHTTDKEKFSNILLYFPFMVAMPQLVYHYEFILLIPLLPVLNFLWKETSSKQQKYSISLMVVGVSLSQWQVTALYLLTENMLAHYIPGFGLLIVLIGICIYKYLQLRDVLKEGTLDTLLEEERTVAV